ncbi:MAG: hypothetical protein BWY15_00083 [Firmicutes bacterium ADurb.Bin193]|nr:MAG: hypothetical protein BWY15_00083 [Firmicutes bacterium ADurb.Bin193]
MSSFKDVGFRPADILIPKNIDMEKWSVVACDQYTSQPEYWSKVERFVGDAPSTLHIVFPEIYLDSGNLAARTDSIDKNMYKYLNEGIFNIYKDSFIYVERTLSDGRVRRGLVGAVDLEAYDYEKGSVSLVRATEKTVPDRIPPRVKIRTDAPLELPHVMLLVDDAKFELIKPLSDSKGELDSVYDFELMQGGGHITGYYVPLEKCAYMPEVLEGLVSDDGLLFAVGDGNHSLAAAKECWEAVKKGLSAEQIENHTARFALAEVVNIHDSALVFEPIHRVLFGCNPQNVIEEFSKYNEGLSLSGGNSQKIGYTYGGKRGSLDVTTPKNGLVLAVLQDFLDEYCIKNNIKIDYIHGEDVVMSLSEEKNSLGFLLPVLEKSSLLPFISSNGVLPRKAFSMGNANEKRFYLECRKIK